ncbi:hypothetical protein ACWF94_33745, partial [Streptomyces sp. NPDC055078]
MGRRTAASALLGAVLLLTGCTVGGQEGPPPATGAPAAADAAAPLPRAVRAQGPREIPGLGPATRARIGDRSRQALVVTGGSLDSDRATATLYERHTTRGWGAVSGPWPARNGRHGWSDDHRRGDLRTPIGVYGLTDAGGRLKNPGTRLPYDRGPAFRAPGRNHEGESLAEAFDHVVAINYNR